MEFPSPPAISSGPLVPPHRPGPSWRSDRLDPRLAGLAAARDSSGNVSSTALEQFWQEISEIGTPLHWPLADAGREGEAGEADYDLCLITFVWRQPADAGPVLLMANRLFDALRVENSLLAHLPGTDVWWAAYEVPGRWRGTYQYLRVPSLEDLSDPALRRTAIREAASRGGLADPFNPTVAASTGGPLRIAQGPQAPDQPWFASRPQVPAGPVRELTMDGPRPGERRQVWVHQPTQRRRHDPEPPGLLVLLDGLVWARQQPIWASLDNLRADRAVPPLVTVAIDTGGRAERTRDLACDPVFADWVLTAVLPKALATVTGPVTADPGRSIVAGQSLGGLTAMYLGYLAPQRFGNVLSQSGAFWFANTPDDHGDGPHAQWLTRTVAALPPEFPDPRCYLEVGTLEWVSAPLVRRMRDVLLDRGAQVSYAEYCGGHDTVCWRHGLADGLRRLTGMW